MIHFFPYLFLLAIGLYAYLDQAPKDAGTIGEHKPINHKDKWLDRLQVGAGLFALLALVTCWSFDMNPLRVGPMAVAGFFWFSLVFRLRLNKLRGRHWAYVAPWSNRYDGLFYNEGLVERQCRCNLMQRNASLKECLALGYHYDKGESLYFNNVDQGTHDIVVSAIHRAGRRTSITELTITVACTWLTHVLTQTP